MKTLWSTSCNNCGGVVLLEPHVTSFTCHHCGARQDSPDRSEATLDDLADGFHD